MPKVHIEHPHSLPKEEVKKRLQGLADRLADKYGIEATWVNDEEANVRRTGVTGKITCLPDKVTVFLDMSFALTPLKGKVEDRIKRELTSCLT
jgi:putative polyhydroxyalkanoate system protein